MRLIYAYNKSLQVGLAVHPLNRMIVEGSSLCLITYLDIGSWTNNGSRYEFYLVKWDLKSIRKLLVTSITFISLLYQSECLFRPDIIVTWSSFLL